MQDKELADNLLSGRLVLSDGLLSENETLSTKNDEVNPKITVFIFNVLITCVFSIFLYHLSMSVLWFFFGDGRHLNTDNNIPYVLLIGLSLVVSWNYTYRFSVSKQLVALENQKAIKRLNNFEDKYIKQHTVDYELNGETVKAYKVDKDILLDALKIKCNNSNVALIVDEFPMIYVKGKKLVFLCINGDYVLYKY